MGVDSIDDYFNNGKEIIRIQAEFKTKSLCFLRDLIKKNYDLYCNVLKTDSADLLFSKVRDEIHSLDNYCLNPNDFYYNQQQVKKIPFVQFGWAFFKPSMEYILDIQIRHHLYLNPEGEEILNGYRNATNKPSLEKQRILNQQKLTRY